MLTTNSKVAVVLLLMTVMVFTRHATAQEQYPQFFDDRLNQQYEQIIQTAQPGHVAYQEVSWLQNQAGNPPAGANQPGGPQARPNPPAPQNPLANIQNRRPTLSRMSRAPDLFGDSFVPLTVGILGDHLFYLGVTSSNLDSDFEANVPVGAGTRRFKNEQTRALPTDRFIFVYNHFHNAVEVKRFGNTGVQSDADHVDQYTFGFEKTFGDGMWSVEMRMPFAGDSDLAVEDISIDSGHVGNLAVTLKRLLYQGEDVAIAAGLAVTGPTGSDSKFNIANNMVRVTIENEAVHLLPYLGIQWTPDENWFVHAFGQVDVSANGNGIAIQVLDGALPGLNGTITEQTLMYLDLSLGYWWFRSEENEGLTGLASVLEFHYTTSLNDAHSSDLNSGNFFNVGNGFNRFDVVNMTVGLHSEWSQNTSVRTAVVVPLGNEEDRFFDSELQLAIIRRF